jgi:hypothetical protein
MRSRTALFLGLFLLAGGLAVSVGQAQEQKKLEKTFQAPNGLTIKVRATKPQALASDVQIIGYFQHKKTGDTVLEVLIDINKMLGGVIQNLRDRGEFVGYETETLVFNPPQGVMKPKIVMLIGYGEDSKFNLDIMQRVGTTCVRECVRLKTEVVAFAPAIRDQGVEKFGTGDVEHANVKGIILAYDTEMRLQKQGLAPPFKIKEYILESGPQFFEETVAGVARGVADATAEIARRNQAPYSSNK